MNEIVLKDPSDVKKLDKGTLALVRRELGFDEPIAVYLEDAIEAASLLIEAGYNKPVSSQAKVIEKANVLCGFDRGKFYICK